jgi:predicted transcriptional regulator
MERGRPRRYTLGMKTAVSVPDELFDRVDRLAQRTRRSRSEVYSAALREYVARHDTDEITEALDRLAVEGQSSADRFVTEAARRRLETSDW